MDQKIFAEREQEFRLQYPDMFTHPGSRPGEVFLRHVLCDAAMVDINAYQSKGLTSARADPANPVLSDLGNGTVEYWPVFADLRELIETEERHKAEQAV